MTGPEHYREAERLLTLADYHDDPDRRAAAQVHATLALGAATAMAAPVDGETAGLNVEEYDAWRAAVEGKPAPARTLTVYRASHDPIVMGLYTTAAKARKHCETDERRSWPTGTRLSFDWIEDEKDGVAELVVVAGQNEESTTGYTVTSLKVAAEYDPEADA
ncbi:hypothetical protein [Streptomyces sp. NPDC050560]|uniref:hypothetical protein n=1 Tax=Streptomyces sp. NPDC050560 TaxID=3365630 RepID=UPI00378C1B8D